jgi:hypothetical protein
VWFVLVHNPPDYVGLFSQMDNRRSLGFLYEGAHSPFSASPAAAVCGIVRDLRPISARRCWLMSVLTLACLWNSESER